MEAIQHQVEFYFSDSNYRKDTFLRAAAESDPEGFVPISVLLTFNKLKNLTTEVTKVAEAVRGSDSLVLSADETKIKRAEPLPDVDNSADRTLYVKGFPVDDASVTIDAITSLFSPSGKVTYVRLRRGNDKKFKGSAFVEFATEAEMQAAVQAANKDDKVVLTYKDVPFLCVIPFRTWHNNKQAKFTKRKGGKDSAQATVETGKRAREEDASTEVVFEKGLLVKLSNLPADSNAIDIKETLKKSIAVKYVDYTVGQSVATVRLGDVETANKLVELTGKEKLFGDDSNVEAKPLDGEEELAFWTKKATEEKNAKKSNPKGNRGRKPAGRGFKKQRR